MQSLNHYVEIVHTCRAMNFRTIRMYSVSVQGDSKLRECLLTKHTWFTPLRIIYLLTISDQKTLDKLQCVWIFLTFLFVACKYFIVNVSLFPYCIPIKRCAWIDACFYNRISEKYRLKNKTLSFFYISIEGA